VGTGGDCLLPHIALRHLEQNPSSPMCKASNQGFFYFWIHELNL
jgi:hypothetical protein